MVRSWYGEGKKVPVKTNRAKFRVSMMLPGFSEGLKISAVLG